jgi:DeoR/GlpR family transcriptional regulator of sugar metabolism
MSADAARPTLPAQRRQDILEAVRAGSTHVADLAQSFGVSEMTVRRDLAELARDGKIERVRGGAINAPGEPPFEETVVERREAKDRIGAAAAALVQDGETVMIDIGTTTLMAACHLHGRQITVVTSSLAVYEELVPDPAIELLLPGGLVRRNYRSLVGVLAEDTLRQLQADVCFLGTSGVDSELAVWDSTMIEVPIKRAMIGASDRVVLLADAEKFTSASLVRVCDAADVSTVVTDRPLPPAFQPAIEDNGIEVIIA